MSKWSRKDRIVFVLLCFCVIMMAGFMIPSILKQNSCEGTTAAYERQTMLIDACESNSNCKTTMDDYDTLLKKAEHMARACKKNEGA